MVCLLEVKQLLLHLFIIVLHWLDTLKQGERRCLDHTRKYVAIVGLFVVETTHFVVIVERLSVTQDQKQRTFLCFRVFLQEGYHRDLLCRKFSLSPRAIKSIV